MKPPLLVISGLEKSYAVPVLKGIDLQIEKGEVHALVGANGAGKTTLCNIIAGVTEANGGQMFWGNEPHKPRSIKNAETSGIRFVMQELNLVDTLSVAENLFLGELPVKGALIDFKHLYKRAETVLRDMGLDEIHAKQSMSSLGIGHKQLVEIARALINPCRLLILDEPTAALTDPQIDLLFEKIRALQANGTGIIYISHRMDEIERIADRTSILRDGEIVATLAKGEVKPQEIVRLMAGSISEPTHKAAQVARDNRALGVRALSTRDKLKNIDLDIHFGEVLGIAGLVGSGRTELLRAIFAADKLDQGQIYLGTSSKPLNFKSPVDAVRHGIGLIPEDRKDQGLFIDQTITTNMTLAALSKYSSTLGWIDSDKEQSAIANMLDLLDIKCNDSRQIVRELSGGNQQKVSIARNLLLGCNILLFDEPTRGVDIHAKSVIYTLLDQLASEGKAVVIVSSETRELTQICDHIAVMSNGRLTETFNRDEWTSEKIMEASFRAYVNQDAA
jgi:ribose transport system ATP-binding protein